MFRVRVGWIVVILAAGAAILALALFVAGRRMTELAAEARGAAGLRQQILELQSRVAELTREIGALHQQLGAAAVEPGVVPRLPRPELPAGTIEALRNLGQLKDDLASARAAGERFQLRIGQLDAELAQVREENSVLSARQSDLQEQLAGAGRIIEALRAETKGNADRIAQLQLTNQTLREETRQAREKIRRLGELAAQLEDVNRRREAYLTAIVRRYRDITDQYRSLVTGRSQDRAEASMPTPAELSKTENAVSMAEEDLRQLRNLNAQAEQLQREIRKY